MTPTPVPSQEAGKAVVDDWCDMHPLMEAELEGEEIGDLARLVDAALRAERERTESACRGLERNGEKAAEYFRRAVAAEATHRVLYDFVETLGKWPVRTSLPIRDMFDTAKLARDLIEEIDSPTAAALRALSDSEAKGVHNTVNMAEAVNNPDSETKGGKGYCGRPERRHNRDFACVLEVHQAGPHVSAEGDRWEGDEPIEQRGR